MPYQKNRQIFVCPSDPNPKSGWAYGLDGSCNDGWGIPTPISYGMNEVVFGFAGFTDPSGTGCFGATDPADWVGYEPKSIAAIPTPASTYLIADYGRESMETFWINNLKAANYTRVFNQSAPGRGMRADATEPWKSRKEQGSVYRHQMGSNIVFAEGHAKWRNGKAIMSGDFGYDGRSVSAEGLCLREYPGTVNDASNCP